MGNHPHRSNHKYFVLVSQRGMDGEWFDYPLATARTFRSEKQARSYASSFAVAQRAAGVVGTRILVRRKFSDGYGQIAAYHV